MSKHFFLAACLASFWLFACGGDPVVPGPMTTPDAGSDSDGTVDAAAPDAEADAGESMLSPTQTALQAAETSMGVAVCEVVSKCCSAEEQALFGFDEEQACSAEMFVGAATDLGAATIAEAIEQERVAFDEAELQKCLDAYQALNCAGVSSTNPLALGIEECGNVLQPKTPVDAGCVYPFECVDSFCNDDKVCQAFAAEGDACSVGECGAGLYCNELRRTCQSAGETGDSCQSNRACRSQSCLVTLDGNKRCGTANAICVGEE